MEEPQRGGTGLNSGSDDDGFDTDEWAALARVLGDASPGDSDDESNGDGGGAWSDADLDVEDAALDPWADDDMDLPDEPPRTRAEAKQQMYAELEAAYGPHYAASDVRLYVKRRQHNAARRRPAQRGGFPMNDALPREATFGKLGGRFRDVVLHERSTALAASLQVSAPLAARLYEAVPYLLTRTTLEVALQMRSAARALGADAADVAAQVGAARDALQRVARAGGQ
ncbi:hypothetical protein MNEG_1819 [Monoraphidium neglectum]|uniref:Uncharacterized protein n=1 Tax=Monoraphidium neglectum TaxID=145388 RepID=A0A0D2LI72_9CHLO|nr:hypothetical protein MNEG_1819 [Monoraphidium neglectum]KIZ06134.1 hypothetical protein MNEG_1819 [Monoraphidium neglectum]|eukprot:XP_013905153.1 hypothetical protein MNEG_1819 [Monoraphidium neglectum]